MSNTLLLGGWQWLLLAVLLAQVEPARAGSLFGGDRLSKFTNKRGFRWQTNRTEHFSVYYEANSAVVPRLQEIAASVEVSRVSVLRLIQKKDFPDRIHVFLVDSKPRMKDLMGSTPYGGAIAKIRVVFAVVNATNNGCSTHEFCHVIAGATWGKPERWIDEGFASYSDERWRNRDVIVAELARQGRLLPLKTLAKDFLRHPDDLTYHESASFLGFVIERYGWDKFKAIWRGGYQSIPKVLGRSMSELETEWRASLPAKADAASDSKP